MGLMNAFRRNKARAEGEAVHDVMRPWWAWGPLGLIWYGGHHNTQDTHNIDGGNFHQGDGGHFNNHIDPGGFGGFDGGAGGAGGV